MSSEQKASFTEHVSKADEELYPRVVASNPELGQPEYASNYVVTTKYTLLTFLPFSLFAQFRRLANCYFLLIAILQSIPEISPLSPYTAIAPLVFVVGLSMIREALEDFNRYQSDKDANNRRAEKFDPATGEFVQCAWADLKVGDLVLVKDKTGFPADLLLLTSNHEDGACYIDTMNLDGETNLKRKKAHDATVVSGEASHVQAAGLSSAVLRCEGPSGDLYHFNGVLELKSGERVPVDANQLLLRGARLRNTHWIVGLVMFTGADTREMQNAKDAAYKQSNVERKMNWLIVGIFIAQTLLCIISAIIGGEWMRNYGHDHKYLDCNSYFDCDPDMTAFLQYWTYVVLLNTLIPSSLVVTVEVVKFVQALFINWDQQMHHDIEDSVTREIVRKGAQARTTTLNEELGQIKYIFSDKTGTLTENKMLFKACSIMGEQFWVEAPETEEYARLLAEATAITAAGKAKGADDAKLFFMAMAMCNDVLLEVTEEGIEINADSPDEVALVKGAGVAGYSLVGKKGNVMTVSIDGNEEQWEVLRIIPFTSARKRMTSVIRKRGGDGRLLVLMKGADNFVLERCSTSEHTQVVEHHLKLFAQTGLRTLCFGARWCTQESLAGWLKRYNDADLLPPEPREAAVEALAAELERDLRLVGSTAIEDKLQQGVPETILRFLTANIKVWVLTGDKMETAIEIARASSLILPTMRVYSIEGENAEQVASQLKKYNEEVEREGYDDLALVIDGKALTYIVGQTEAGGLIQLAPSVDFMQFADKCRSVVVCRSAPLQKALVVELVRTCHPATITLAVGDGANDVSMIRAASVGIGIAGQEGMQAVRSADYAVQQFSDLDRLVLFHGRLAYTRLGRMITYFFYKNMVFTLPLWLFGFYSAYSGQTFYDDMYITLYNILFTLLPVFAFALFEHDVPEEKAVLFPELYHACQANKNFNTRAIGYWFALGVVHSVLFTLIPIYALPFGNSDPSGLWSTSVASFTTVVICTTVQILLITRYYTWITALFYSLSFALYFATTFTYDQMPTQVEGAIAYVTATSGFWYMLFWCIGFIVLLHFTIQAAIENFADTEDLDPTIIIRRTPLKELEDMLAEYIRRSSMSKKHQRLLESSRSSRGAFQPIVPDPV